MNIVLIGAQGSGKGTQAARLSQALGIRHIASGDLFRKAVQDGTELGLLVKEYLDRGELVSDKIAVTVVLGRISEPDCASGVLLDGFPRTISQAEALDKGLEAIGRTVDCALYLSVPREVLLRRLSGRYICRAYQHVYNSVTHPPKVSGVCDIDGSELYQRSDDRGEAIQRRLDIFFNETMCVADYYQRQHKLYEANGNQSIEQVHASLVSTVRSCIAEK
ncbi:MAG: adenylate kinase [Chloroflexi bacterium]|nr:MAG: adenylate kinase [Chloroflexota bacterium]